MTIIPNAASTQELNEAALENATREIIGQVRAFQEQLLEACNEAKLHPIIGQKLMALVAITDMHEMVSYCAGAQKDPKHKTVLYDQAAAIELVRKTIKGLMVHPNDLSFEEFKQADPYLSQISDDSLEVLQHFGAEAPALLNTYSCAVEDALIEQVKKNQALQVELAELKGEPAPVFEEQLAKTSRKSLALLKGDS